MKPLLPSERYREIKADVPNRYLGIKEPFLTERALLELLDEIHAAKVADSIIPPTTKAPAIPLLGPLPPLQPIK